MTRSKNYVESTAEQKKKGKGRVPPPKNGVGARPLLRVWGSKMIFLFFVSKILIFLMSDRVCFFCNALRKIFRIQLNILRLGSVNFHGTFFNFYEMTPKKGPGREVRDVGPDRQSRTCQKQVRFGKFFLLRVDNLAKPPNYFYFSMIGPFSGDVSQFCEITPLPKKRRRVRSP